MKSIRVNVISGEHCGPWTSCLCFIVTISSIVICHIQIRIIATIWYTLDRKTMHVFFNVCSAYVDVMHGKNVNSFVTITLQINIVDLLQPYTWPHLFYIRMSWTCECILIHFRCGFRSIPDVFGISYGGVTGVGLLVSLFVFILCKSKQSRSNNSRATHQTLTNVGYIPSGMGDTLFWF